MKQAIVSFVCLTSIFLLSSCLDQCDPACRTGYTCIVTTCTTVCNPACASTETCNADTGQCETPTSACDPECAGTETCNETSGECETSADISSETKSLSDEELFEDDFEDEDDSDSEESESDEINYDWENEDQTSLLYQDFFKFQLSQFIGFSRQTLSFAHFLTPTHKNIKAHPSQTKLSNK